MTKTPRKRYYETSLGVFSPMHIAEQAEAHKLARAEGDGPVSNETARAYLKAYPRDDEETPAERYDREVFGDEWNTPMSL